MIRFIFAFLFIFIFSSPASPQTINPSASKNTVKVWGLAYSNLVTYPEHGLTSKSLMDALIKARRQYPLEMTLEQIERVGDAATKHYRAAGYKFHSVYVPPQKMNNGVVHFRVLEATLGDVQVRAQRGISQDKISRNGALALFDDLIGEPIYQPDIDQRIHNLKNQPGVDAIAFYSRGSNTGQVRLNIKLKEQLFNGYIQADNFGAQSTGEHRLLTGVDWLSPTGRFDQLSLGIAGTYNNDLNSFGYLRYQMPLWNLSNQIWLNANRSQFTIGEEFSGLDFSGVSDSFDMGFRHQFSNTHSLSLTGRHQKADYDSILQLPEFERDETSKTLNLDYQGQWKSPHNKVQQSLRIGYANGEFAIDGFTNNGRGGNQDLEKIHLSSQSRVWFAQESRRGINYLHVNVQGQYTEKSIASVEKFSTTGYTANRGFKPGYFASDRGARLNLEWHFPGLWNHQHWRITPFLFFDMSSGEKIDRDNQTIDRAEMSSAGIGVNLNYQSFNLKISLHDEISQDVDSQLSIKPQSFNAMMSWHF